MHCPTLIGVCCQATRIACDDLPELEWNQLYGLDCVQKNSIAEEENNKKQKVKNREWQDQYDLFLSIAGHQLYQ